MRPIRKNIFVCLLGVVCCLLLRYVILFILLKIFSRSISEDECGTENSASATRNCYCQSGEYDCITGFGLDGETCKATTTKGCGTGCTKRFSGETAKYAVCNEAGYFESGKTEGAAPISTGLCVYQLGFTLNGETCESSNDPSDSSTRGEYESFSPA